MKKTYLFLLAQFFVAHLALGADLKVIASTKTPLTIDKSTQVTLFLTDNGKGVGEDKLKTVHTEKVHALIIDPTLTDYQHIHPESAEKAGEYLFSFTPHTANNYRIWLDVTPVDGKQQYVITNLTGANAHNPAVVEQLSMSSTIDDYHFQLSFDKPLVVNQEVMGTVMITDKKDKPVKTLRPIMGAFAHIVAFSEDYRTILHIHPMGKEPKEKSDRGGPELKFHMEPTKAGFVKLFVQVNVDGDELFVPFGFKVNP